MLIIFCYDEYSYFFTPSNLKYWRYNGKSAELDLFCFRWYKFIEGTTRKQPVTLDDRVKQVSGTLIIKEAKVEDSGKYLCVVNNSVGGQYNINKKHRIKIPIRFGNITCFYFRRIRGNRFDCHRSPKGYCRTSNANC